MDDLVKALASLGVRSSGRKKASAGKAAAKNRGYVFLSYCAEDYDFTASLHDFLQQQKLLCWEYSSGQRDLERPLWRELESRINDSAVVLSIVSPDWRNSVWAVREYFYAKEKGKPVFLLEARKIGPTLAIAGDHRIDFCGSRREKALELLSRELKRRGV